MSNGKVEVHLDGELKYWKKKGEWIRVFCILDDDEWLHIEKFDKVGKGFVIIESVNSIVVPIKPFIRLLQEFAKEMEAEKE